MTDIIPPSVNGITEGDLVSWRHNPVTKVVLDFLRDYGEALKRERGELLDGSRTSPDPYLLGEFKGRCSTLAEMSDMQFASLSQFYLSPEGDDNKNAAEAAED